MKVDYGGRKTKYRLAGVVYHGTYHFTARLIDKNSNTWCHDGMTNAGKCIPAGKVKDVPDMSVLEGRVACLAIYTSL
ncbi:uncharacterized protein STEHIDRAFT_54710 [Stereum hirsutum FP-91666 SS1]|uniref:uncharacterized protein n=1 Tax=Stereum hirsutum (strain FP-91666) TaxID=721885 RepID=UPI000440BD67|nr:uncharacterized protein STEHIDRAFT_54710 [Stereum hirsutum FP-91666 SS1]EIM87775.1 hypothetical protein STEHIDRAFT_54710 [Stereum hirsutum FP-91666 SS1]